MGGEQSDTFNESGSPLIVEAEEVVTENSTIQEQLTVQDDDDIRWGTDEDFITEYESGNDRWRLFDNSNSQDLLYGEKNGPLQAQVNFDLGANHLVNGDEIEFNEVSAPSHSGGQLYYDTDTKSLSFDTDQTGVTVNIGEENLVRVRNNSGSTISNGAVVYISGFHANSGFPEVSLAKADAESTALIAGVATQDISDSSDGYITSQGIVRGLDLSSFSNGDEVWLSASTAGAMTTSEPSDPNFSVKIGSIARAVDGNGELRLNPDARRPALFTQGSVIFSNSNGRITQDNSNFFWDNTANELGIGTNTPSGTLDVRGNIVDDTNTIWDSTNTRIGTDLVDTTSIDLSIAPTWTGTHTFNNGVVGNEDAGTEDFRWESADSANMLTVHGASSPNGSQVSIHTGVNNDWGALFVGARDASGAADVDMVATLGDSNESATIDANNASVWQTSIRGMTINAGGATTVTDTAPLYVDGPIAAGTNVTITNQYLGLFENSSDNTVLEILDGGRVGVLNGNLRIGGSNAIEDASGNAHLTINDAGTLDVGRTLNLGGNEATDFDNIQLQRRSSDVTPANGEAALWVSDGTGSGTDGDLMYAETTSGGTTSTYTVDKTAV